MKKRHGLIRNKPLTSSTGEFRVLCVNQSTSAISVLGITSSLEEAKKLADIEMAQGVDIYVQGEENRVLYRV